jgi:hypothetical protein
LAETESAKIAIKSMSYVAMFFCAHIRAHIKNRQWHNPVMPSKHVTFKLAVAILLATQFAGVPADAKIPRDRAQVRAFRAEHPCPATGLTKGVCPGYHVDHVVALCAGGADRPWNMQWITREDHKVKTRVDVRECRAMKRAAPAAHQ